MNKQYFLLLLLILVAPIYLFAQQSSIVGQLVDEGSNAPLPGVSVNVVGSTKATKSDF